MATLLVLHGANLNLLGSREPSVYGSTSLEAIDIMLKERAQAQGHQLSSLQSNAEFKLIDRIHDAKKAGVNFIIFNPGAFTQYQHCSARCFKWCCYSFYRATHIQCLQS